MGIHEFWMRCYIAAIRSGNSTSARFIADEGVKQFDQFKRKSHEPVEPPVIRPE